MADRAELMEAALDVYPEGLALLDGDDRVVFWNRAAEQLTGYPGAEVIGRRLPDTLEGLVGVHADEVRTTTRTTADAGRGMLVHAQHKLGRDVPVIARCVVLRDGLGVRIGTAAGFHATELASALPHGESSEGAEVRESRAELKDRLENEYAMFVHEGVPLAVLWVVVDQAADLRKTHGARASETMLEKVERALANGLLPGEEVGRWGDDEFLVLSHQGTAEAVRSHAQTLAGLARTADFRWWGDRLSLTVSVGAASCHAGETLIGLLERARAAMQDSARVGGNGVKLASPPRAADEGIEATRRQPCSPS